MLEMDEQSRNERIDKISIQNYWEQNHVNSLFCKNTLITGTVPTTNLNICLKAIEKSANVIITKENTKLVVSKK